MPHNALHLRTAQSLTLRRRNAIFVRFGKIPHFCNDFQPIFRNSKINFRGKSLWIGGTDQFILFLQCHVFQRITSAAFNQPDIAMGKPCSFNIDPIHVPDPPTPTNGAIRNRLNTLHCPLKDANHRIIPRAIAQRPIANFPLNQLSRLYVRWG